MKKFHCVITAVKTIILGGFSANCYLLKTENGFVLIDTGGKSKRRKLEQELAKEGCKPGNLNVIILTHGDFDHTGNCAYLRKTYHTKIAMHHDDVGMVEHGDMFWNRQKGNLLVRILVNLFFNIKKFTPDVHLDENSDLSISGLNAKVLHLPGHSTGSIGILTSGNDLFCGDVFTNLKKPGPSKLVDNEEELKESIKRVFGLGIRTVYPGHGHPFLMSDYR